MLTMKPVILTFAQQSWSQNQSNKFTQIRQTTSSTRKPKRPRRSHCSPNCRSSYGSWFGIVFFLSENIWKSRSLSLPIPVDLSRRVIFEITDYRISVLYACKESRAVSLELLSANLPSGSWGIEIRLDPAKTGVYFINLLQAFDHMDTALWSFTWLPLHSPMVRCLITQRTFGSWHLLYFASGLIPNSQVSGYLYEHTSGRTIYNRLLKIWRMSLWSCRTCHFPTQKPCLQFRGSWREQATNPTRLFHKLDWWKASQLPKAPEQPTNKRSQAFHLEFCGLRLEQCRFWEQFESTS